MLSPSYLMGCADDVTRLYAQLESDISADIAQRVAKMGKYSSTSQWQAQKLRETMASYDMAQRMLEKCNQQAQSSIQDVFYEGCYKAVYADDKVYSAAGMSASSIASSKALTDVILAGLQKTNGVMSNLTMTTARDASHAISNALDRAYMQVISGAFDYNTAARRVINELGSKGYTSFTYDSGSKISLEAGVRRALLTGLNQTCAELQLSRADELGTDLVEVSSHAGARPTHAEWQGQIYSLSGNSSKYRNFYDATGYGTGDGLCGWNCYHNFYPYVEGVSTPTFMKDPASLLGKTNDELYEETQQQRYLERQVRQSRRHCQTLDAAMKEADTELYNDLYSQFSRASVLLKRREAKLKSYCEQHGLTYNANRVTTFSFSRSTSAKAVWANRKASELTNSLTSSIIKAGATKDEIRTYIKSSAVKKTVNADKQNRHILTSSGYIEGRSYIYGTLETAQELVDMYHGTGNPQLTKKGQWNQKETITTDDIIGVDIDQETKAETVTNRFVIHYSKTGTHVVPTSPLKEEQNND